ncbi:HAD hydrolase-like protein [Lactobacillus bombicola]|uniref:HAD hydrolase-like protein n=1 Tax=Lactobacillus bombicola TaxID=1505723 RepID=UPI000E5770B2|nr:HAD hydrolase-like protein [Lactobacillus bombicola]RHW52560.1 HAD family hydrolase [Lactobacillus bombicola]
MTKFETLIFIPEGSILNESAAERSALKSALLAIGQEFDANNRLKYNKLQSQVKLLSFNERLKFISQTFGISQIDLFTHELQKQQQLVHGISNFLNEIKDKVKLIMLAKETRKTIISRLGPSELLSSFSATYFINDFSQKLPDSQIFKQIIQEQTLDLDTCLVIGTDLADEIQGAVNTNLQSLWLAPKKSKLPISPHPTLHLNKLSDLLFYLDLS